MRLKDLFTIPQGEKITEKRLLTVLVSSICSMLFCMTCLAGTTWAWFTVSVENTGNEIVIASLSPDVSISNGTGPVAANGDGNYQLAAGEYRVSMKFKRDDAGSRAADLRSSSNPVYVIMAVTTSTTDPDTMEVSQQTEYSHFAFASEEDVKELLFTVTKDIQLNFFVSWLEPLMSIELDEEFSVLDGMIIDSADETASEPTEEPEETQETEETPSDDDDTQESEDTTPSQPEPVEPEVPDDTNQPEGNEGESDPTGDTTATEEQNSSTDTQ